MTESPKRKLAAKGKTFDIMRPGKAPVQTTSRPVITDQRPKVKDTTLKTKPVHATSNSHTAVRQALAALQPESDPVREKTPEASPAATEPEHERSLFKHVDNEPFIVMSDDRLRKNITEILLASLIVLAVAAIVLDLLLDAGKLTWNMPHTHFLQH